MRRLLFDYSPFFIPLCLFAGAGYGWLLYYFNGDIRSARLRAGLFAMRAVVVATLAFLMLRPAWKYARREAVPPTVAIIIDNSASMGALRSSKHILEKLQPVREQLTDAGYRVAYRDLDNAPIDTAVAWGKRSTDLTAALRRAVASFDDQYLSHIVLYTDGIFNRGASPLHFASPVPVSAVGAGDTVAYPDLSIQSLSHNKIARQGSRFPLRAQILCESMRQQSFTVALYREGKEIARKQAQTADKTRIEIEFAIAADREGLQTYTARILPLASEKDTRNNAMSAYVDVVKDKKKICLVAASPHPDVRALKEAIEKNASYELEVIIPSAMQTVAAPSPDAELIIFHGAFGGDRDMDAWTQKALASKLSLLFILTRQSRLQNIPLALQVRLPTGAGYDEVTPALAPSFSLFRIDGGAETLRQYPPASVPSGDVTLSPAYHTALRQRIGNVETDRPLMFARGGEQKIGFILGEGIWQWRMQEFAMNDDTRVFDELTGKLIQYLCARASRSPFVCEPTQRSFEESEAVSMNVQAYNDLFEDISGQPVDIRLTNSQGKTYSFHIVTGEQGSEYPLNVLPPDTYAYRGTTVREGKTLVSRGKFAVTPEQIENQGGAADFSLLRKLAAQTNGKFYRADAIGSLAQYLAPAPPSKLRNDETFHPLIEWEWLLPILLALLCAEWSIRKYQTPSGI